MANAVVSALKEKGFEAQAVEVPPQGGAGKAREALVRTAANRDLLFVLLEWKTDSMVNTGLDYEVTLDVLDATGATLGSAQVKGRETTSGTASSVEKDVQGWFAAKVAGLLAHEGVAAAFK
jgi:hypothetical protein